MVSKFEKCPFCGSKDIDPEGVASFKEKEWKDEAGNLRNWNDHATPERLIHSPACNNCGATSGDSNWNTRTQPTAEVEPSCDVVELIKEIDEELITLNKWNRAWSTPRLDYHIKLWQKCKAALQQKPKADVELVEALLKIQTLNIKVSGATEETTYKILCNEMREIAKHALSTQGSVALSSETEGRG